MKIIHGITDTGSGRSLGAGARSIPVTAGVIGAVLLVAVGLVMGWESFLRSWFISFSFFLSLSLGALFFVLLQHLTRAGWSVTVRRLAEAMAANVFLVAILFIPLVAGMNVIWEWTHVEEGHELFRSKAVWLSPTFFTIRIAVYFGSWLLTARWLLRKSREQDESGDPRLTLAMQKWSPLATVLYGITVTFASFDLFMSMDPHWFSTIYGVYFFSGGMVGFFAALVIVMYLLRRSGKLYREITIEHWHDVGKQLFAWNVFWAYIAFSQMMLIWYANIPEETTWYQDRWTGGWEALSWVLLVGHFALPFLLMLPRVMKRNPAVLTAMAVWLLVFHYLDLYWLLVPDGGAEIPFSVMDVLVFLGQLGLFIGGFTLLLTGSRLLPEQDPRLPEALAFENV